MQFMTLICINGIFFIGIETLSNSDSSLSLHKVLPFYIFQMFYFKVTMYYIIFIMFLQQIKLLTHFPDRSTSHQKKTPATYIWRTPAIMKNFKSDFEIIQGKRFSFSMPQHTAVPRKTLKIKLTCFDYFFGRHFRVLQ